jgi:hypothetical protein
MRFASLLVVVSSLALAQGIPLKSGAGSDLATVNSAKSLLVVRGASTTATYICSAGGLATTAAYAISLESEVSRGFKIQKICVGSSAATAAALQTVTVRRQTAASSGGTVITAEGTGTSGVSKMDPADGNWGGICRLTGTAGAAGAAGSSEVEVGSTGRGRGVSAQCAQGLGQTSTGSGATARTERTTTGAGATSCMCGLSPVLNAAAPATVAASTRIADFIIGSSET